MEDDGRMNQKMRADRPEGGKFYEQASQNTTETENSFSQTEDDEEEGYWVRYVIVESYSASQRLSSGRR